MTLMLTISIRFFIRMNGPTTGGAVAAMGRTRDGVKKVALSPGCNVGVERCQGSWRLSTVHVKLLQEQIILNFEKV
jgi:hypothetical protein